MEEENSRPTQYQLLREMILNEFKFDINEDEEIKSKNFNYQMDYNNIDAESIISEIKANLFNKGMTNNITAKIIIDSFEKKFIDLESKQKKPNKRNVQKNIPHIKKNIKISLNNIEHQFSLRDMNIYNNQINSNTITIQQMNQFILVQIVKEDYFSIVEITKQLELNYIKVLMKCH